VAPVRNQVVILAKTHNTDAAQVNCSLVGTILYLNSTADDIAAAACGQINLDIFIGPDQTGAVSLDGLKIAGDKAGGGGLHADSCPGMTSISSDSLQIAGAWLTAINSSSLTKMSFPQLSWIGLALNLIDVPLLEQLDLAAGLIVGEFDVPVTTASGSINNTGLSKVDGIFSGTPRDILITNNPSLHTVNLPSTQIYLQYNANYTGNLLIVNNSASVTVNLPNLFSVAGSMSLGNVSELSIPSLGLVNGSMDLIAASFSSLSAPQLERINGDLNITGTFSGYTPPPPSQTERMYKRWLIRPGSLNFPNLTYIGGNLFLESTKYLDCEPFRQLYINNGIKGLFTCQGAPASGSTASSAASPTSTSTTTASPTGSGLSGGAKGGIAAAAAIVAGLAVIGIVLVMWRKRREKTTRETSTAADLVVASLPSPPQPKELPHDELYGRLELEGTPNKVAELHGHQGPLPNVGRR
jgi:hypothetical protein